MFLHARTLVLARSFSTRLLSRYIWLTIVPMIVALTLSAVPAMAQECGAGETLECSQPYLALVAAPHQNVVKLLFRDACVRHDFCYRHGECTYGMTRKECDDELYRRMRAICRKPSLTNILQGLGSGGVSVATCYGWASEVYAGVRAGATFAYRTTTTNPPCTYCEYKDNTGWRWFQLGNGPGGVGSLAAVARSSGAWLLDLFMVRSSDKHVTQYSLDSAGWHWQDLGNPPYQLTGPLTALSRSNSSWVLDVFGATAGGNVIQLALNSSGWSWTDLGNRGHSWKGALTAVSRRPGSGQWVIDVFGVNQNGRIIQLALDGTGWHWFDLGNGGYNLTGAVAAVSRNIGPWILDVFALDTNGQIVQLSLNSSGWHWNNLGSVPTGMGGGRLAGPLTAAVRHNTSYVIDLFGVGADNHVLQFSLTSRGWQWNDLGNVPPLLAGGSIGNALAAAVRKSGPWVVDVFAIGGNGYVTQLALLAAVAQ